MILQFWFLAFVSTSQSGKWPYCERKYYGPVSSRFGKCFIYLTHVHQLKEEPQVISLLQKHRNLDCEYQCVPTSINEYVFYLFTVYARAGRGGPRTWVTLRTMRVDVESFIYLCDACQRLRSGQSTARNMHGWKCARHLDFWHAQESVLGVCIFPASKSKLSEYIYIILLLYCS